MHISLTFSTRGRVCYPSATDSSSEGDSPPLWLLPDAGLDGSESGSWYLAVAKISTLEEPSAWKKVIFYGFVNSA